MEHSGSLFIVSYKKKISIPAEYCESKAKRQVMTVKTRTLFLCLKLRKMNKQCKQPVKTARNFFTCMAIRLAYSYFIYEMLRIVYSLTLSLSLSSSFLN
jgi:hypothetical protein